MEAENIEVASEVLPGVRHAERHELSPFMEQLTVTTRRKRLTVSRGSPIINQITGEYEAVTEIAQVIAVDDGQFVKLFTKDLAEWFDLSRAGQRVFGALLATIQEEAIRNDRVYFDRMCTAVRKFNLPSSTFYRGIDELLGKGFIARHLSTSWYFINPAFFFNGDRARFVKEYRLISSVNKPLKPLSLGACDAEE